MVSIGQIAAMLAIVQTVAACACIDYREMKVAAADRMSECQSRSSDTTNECANVQSETDKNIRATWSKCIRQVVATSAIILLAVAVAALSRGGGDCSAGCNTSDYNNYSYY